MKTGTKERFALKARSTYGGMSRRAPFHLGDEIKERRGSFPLVRERHFTEEDFRRQWYSADFAETRGVAGPPFVYN